MTESYPDQGICERIVSNEDLPLVSILMPVFNCESTLPAAIQSIIGQTFQNWELVLCDDASTDATPEVLRSFAGIGDDRIRIVANARNMRLAFSLNRCLGLARGEFVARMDGDDVSEPDRLARQVEFLRDNPDVDLVGTSMLRFDDSGPTGVVFPASLEPDRTTLGTSSTAPFCHATIMARRHVFDGVGGYTVAWRTQRTEDLDLWFKFFAAGFHGRNLPEPLYRVRVDRAALRRRSFKARLQAVATRVVGNRSLGYPLKYYTPAALELIKVFVPNYLIEFRRAR